MKIRKTNELNCIIEQQVFLYHLHGAVLTCFDFITMRNHFSLKYFDSITNSQKTFSRKFTYEFTYFHQQMLPMRSECWNQLTFNPFNFLVCIIDGMHQDLAYLVNLHEPNNCKSTNVTKIIINE